MKKTVKRSRIDDFLSVNLSFVGNFSLFDEAAFKHSSGFFVQLSGCGHNSGVYS